MLCWLIYVYTIIVVSIRTKICYRFSVWNFGLSTVWMVFNDLYRLGLFSSAFVWLLDLVGASFVIHMYSHWMAFFLGIPLSLSLFIWVFPQLVSALVALCQGFMLASLPNWFYQLTLCYTCYCRFVCNNLCHFLVS